MYAGIFAMQLPPSVKRGNQQTDSFERLNGLVSVDRIGDGN